MAPITSIVMQNCLLMSLGGRDNSKAINCM